MRIHTCDNNVFSATSNDFIKTCVSNFFYVGTQSHPIGLAKPKRPNKAGSEIKFFQLVTIIKPARLFPSSIGTSSSKQNVRILLLNDRQLSDKGTTKSDGPFVSKRWFTSRILTRLQISRLLVTSIKRLRANSFFSFVLYHGQLRVLRPNFTTIITWAPNARLVDSPSAFLPYQVQVSHLDQGWALPW